MIPGVTSKILGDDLYYEDEEFTNELFKINLFRNKVICIFFILLELIIFLIYILTSGKAFLGFINLKHMYFHITMFIVSPLWFFIFKKIESYKTINKKITSIFQFYFHKLYIVLEWCYINT
ncbi:hypothetical protein AGR56_14700 [Clostridium sp. DMHC 10]|nr:hypothetical protein AGR56_14700 [Clostridium sp. DMHC 10]